jgi:hypothetical protein
MLNTKFVQFHLILFKHDNAKPKHQNFSTADPYSAAFSSESILKDFCKLFFFLFFFFFQYFLSIKLLVHKNVFKKEIINFFCCTQSPAKGLHYKTFVLVHFSRTKTLSKIPLLNSLWVISLCKFSFSWQMYPRIILSLISLCKFSFFPNKTI